MTPQADVSCKHNRARVLARVRVRARDRGRDRDRVRDRDRARHEHDPWAPILLSGGGHGRRRSVLHMEAHAARTDAGVDAHPKPAGRYT